MRRLLLLSCLGLACTLRGDGELAEESRELPAFTAVEVFDDFTAAVAVDPALSAADPVAVTVSGDRNALGRLFTRMHGEGTLSVAVDPNQLTRLSLTPALEASVPALRRAYAADRSALEVVGAAGELSLEARESATLTLREASATTLTAAAHEQATLVLAGEGPALTLTVEDAATVDAREFRASTVIVYARGDGDVVVCATAALTIRGAGAAHVVRDCG